MAAITTSKLKSYLSAYFRQQVSVEKLAPDHFTVTVGRACTVSKHFIGEKFREDLWPRGTGPREAVNDLLMAITHREGDPKFEVILVNNQMGTEGYLEPLEIS